MAERYGTDLTALGGYEGGVNSEQGAALVSTSSAGETALLFGPAALREIQAGVANGDFAIAPDDSTGTITAENPLPYWTFTDVNSAGAITCAIVPDTGVGSGNLLKFSVASGTLTGKSATLTRYIPVASSASRSFSYYLEASFLNGSAAPEGTEATVQVSGQFYEQDQTTTTGSAFVGAAETFSFFASPSASGIVAPDFYAATPDLDNTTVPAAAAFLKVTVTIATVATQTATNEISLTEVRATNGLPELLLTDRTQPDIHGPALITADFGELGLRSGSGDGTIDLGADTNIFGADSVNINTSGDVSINAETGVFITQSSGTVAGRINSGSLRLSDTTDASLSSTGHAFQIGASSGANLRMDGNEIMAISNGGTATLLLQNDGGLTRAGGGFAVTGNIDATGSIASEDLIQALGVFRTIQASTGDNAFTARVTGEGTPRFAIFCNGAIEWGAGGARDLNLYRSAAGVLRTDFDLDVGGYLTCDDGATFNALIQGTNISLDGTQGLRHNTPATTTQTSSAAICVVVSSTNYQLRRNTSSARYKTNIVDADEVVLDAARKVKPRHYESTIEDEAGATRLGFIAEEIHEAGLTHAVGYDADGKPETLDPVALIAALWHRVNDLESRLRELEK
jgi:hypothetical protein